MTRFVCDNTACPVLEFEIDVHFTNVTVANASVANIAAQCPHCGQASEQAPVDGTYSTGSTGRLELVEQIRRDLAAAPPASAQELADRLEQAEDPMLTKLAAWVREHRDALVIGVLLAVVAVVLQTAADRLLDNDDLSPQDLDQIIERAEQRGEERSERDRAQQPPQHGARADKHRGDQSGAAGHARRASQSETDGPDPPD